MNCIASTKVRRLRRFSISLLAFGAEVGEFAPQCG
jgi:hypothetical protein